MDDEADRDPEPPASIEERRETRARLNRRYREQEKNRESGWLEQHEFTENPAKGEPVALWEAIQNNLQTVTGLAATGVTDEPFDALADAIGRTRLRPFYWDEGDCADVTRKLDGREATRVYLYFDLSPMPEVRVADHLSYAPVQDELDISTGISQSTLNRLPGRMDERQRHFYASEAETLVRELEKTGLSDLVREPTPETVAPDGEGIPPVQTLARELRHETFPYIDLNRDESVEVSKDAALRVLVAAANGNAFTNDAAENLNLKPWYDGSEIPSGSTLNYHLRKSSREDVTRMFMRANEPLFEIADDHDYFPDQAEVAIDITDWPYFGEPDSDAYVRGTKPGRNYARAWKYITLALVGTDTPLVLLVLPVRKRSEAPGYVRRLLRLASEYLDVHRVYLDAGTEFYSADTISTVDEFGAELVMQGVKKGEEVKQFLNGMARADLDSGYHPYGVGDLDAENYWALGLKSEKRSERRKSEPDEPMDDYTYFYTNVDPSETPPEELASDFRRRWGVETGFRVIKEEFLAKSASPESRIRTFYFNFAAHLYNLWTAANIRRAEELDADLSERKQFTAGRLMQAIEDDPYDLDIPDEPSESRAVQSQLFF
jgi:hypothetical protein